MPKVRGVIIGFHGCVYNKFGNSVLSALQNVFRCKSLNIKREDLIQTTGLNINKRILDVLNKPHVEIKWTEMYGKKPSYYDSLELEKDFYSIYNTNTKYQLLPGVENVLELLKQKNIKIILNSEQKNFNFDNYFDYVITDNDKFKPYSTWKLLERLDIYDIKSVINIDSTVPGLIGGKNLQCINIGVNRWSPHINNISNELKYEVKNSYDLLSLTNPDYLLPHFYNFEEILNEIENY